MLATIYKNDHSSTLSARTPAAHICNTSVSVRLSVKLPNAHWTLVGLFHFPDTHLEEGLRATGADQISERQGVTAELFTTHQR